MSSKKNVIIAVVVVVVIAILGTLACFGVFRGFDAQAYVNGVLKQTLQGDVKTAARLIDGATEEGLTEQYNASIESFVQNSLLKDAEIDAELKNKYIEICKNVFADMKFEVQEAKEVGDESFEVPVTYQASDVFMKYNALVDKEEERLNQKVENSEYTGNSIEEINGQMQAEFLGNAYTLFEEARTTAEYGEEETMIFHVGKSENGLYQINQEELTQFLTKIMGLDKIQG